MFISTIKYADKSKLDFFDSEIALTYLNIYMCLIPNLPTNQKILLVLLLLFIYLYVIVTRSLLYNEIEFVKTLIYNKKK